MKTWQVHLDHFINPHCPLCQETRPIGELLCLPCSQQLPYLEPTQQQSITGCTNTISAFAYQFPIDKLLLRLKFASDLGQLHLLGELIAANILPQIDRIPEAIIAVPLHRQRLQQRGFNQALELARPLAKQLQIPLLTHWVSRSKATAAQTQLSANQRKYNLQQAFHTHKNIPYKHIAIFDDVITTGTTLSELAASLRQQGVERIDAWSCAQTILHLKS